MKVAKGNEQLCGIWKARPRERMCGGLMCTVGSAKLEGMGKNW